MEVIKPMGDQAARPICRASGRRQAVATSPLRVPHRAAAASHRRRPIPPQIIAAGRGKPSPPPDSAASARGRSRRPSPERRGPAPNRPPRRRPAAWRGALPRRANYRRRAPWRFRAPLRAPRAPRRGRSLEREPVSGPGPGPAGPPLKRPLHPEAPDACPGPVLRARAA